MVIRSKPRKRVVKPTPVETKETIKPEVKKIIKPIETLPVEEEKVEIEFEDENKVEEL